MQLAVSGGKSIDVSETTFDREFSEALVHQVVTAYLAGSRAGTKAQKNRSAVRGGGRKPWRQKGTGRARAGTTKNPVWRGGGIVFGPRPRDYSKTVTKGTRKLALRKVLGDLIAAGNVIAVPSFEIADGKTKSFVAAVAGLTDAKKVLIVASSFDDKTYLAGRNVKAVQLETAANVNVEQLLHANTVVFVGDALETIAKRTA